MTFRRRELLRGGLALGSAAVVAAATESGLRSELTFESRIAAARAAIPQGDLSLQVRGFAHPGDGGGAVYRRLGAAPQHRGAFQSADGAWWEIAETSLTPAMLGAIGVTDIADATDESAEILALLETAAAIGAAIAKDERWHGVGAVIEYDAGPLPPVSLRLAGLSSLSGDELLGIANAPGVSLDMEIDAQEFATIALYLDNCPGAKIINPRLSNVASTATEGNSWHLHIANSPDVLVTDPEISGAEAYVTRGIHVAATSPRCTIRGGKISDLASTGGNPLNDADGIVFDGASSVDAQGRVEGTRFENIAKRAVKALAGNVTVEGITGESIATEGYCAVSFYGEAGGSVRNSNFVFDNEVYCVVEIGSGAAIENVEVVGVTYSGPALSSGDQRFLKISSDVTGLYIARNRATDCRNFADWTSCDLVDAVFEDNSSRGCWAAEFQGGTATRVAVRRHKSDKQVAGYFFSMTSQIDCEITNSRFDKTFGMLFDGRLRIAHGNVNGGAS